MGLLSLFEIQVPPEKGLEGAHLDSCVLPTSSPLRFYLGNQEVAKPLPKSSGFLRLFLASDFFSSASLHNW